jgi:hypothetical protein
MYGTNGHARLKSRSRAQLDALMQEWQQVIVRGRGVGHDEPC